MPQDIGTLLAQIPFFLIFATTGVLTLVMVFRQILLSFVMPGRSQVNPFSRIPLTEWPSVTIMVAAYNEEAVIEGCLRSLAGLDYPADRLDILVINDRSRDGTREIVDHMVSRTEGRIRALHRPFDAVPGKPAAMADGLRTVSSDVLVFFDADYLPEPALLKKLVAPFVDPQVGATMGRVTPYNTDANVLTRLLDMERRGGYTIDLAARGAFNLLPQFGGTVGGIRVSAMNEVGGWSSDTLAEDTDVTYRLFIGGYTVEYVDDAVCYEESPEDWRIRMKQVRRWACGHNQCLLRYLVPTLTTREQPLYKRLDAALVLCFYLLPVLAFANLLAALVYPTLYAYPPLNFAVVSAVAFAMSFGNFAPYLQIMAAAIRDRQPDAVRLLPLIVISSTISMLAATHGLWLAIRSIAFGKALKWDKTVRYRKTANA
jgi:cellulose synthase/poly-beta-1,6-N-acetylglucosamine synthase-like glycosyltransferase